MEMLEAVAHRLNNICRFNGAVQARECDRIYSVLEHTTIGMALMRMNGESIGNRLGFATHDMAEAFVGDLITPIKTIPAIAEPFGKAEEFEHLRVCKAIGVDPALSKRKVVKRYDSVMLAAEIYEVALIDDPCHPYVHDEHYLAASMIASGDFCGVKPFFIEWGKVRQFIAC